MMLERNMVTAGGYHGTFRNKRRHPSDDLPTITAVKASRRREVSKAAQAGPAVTLGGLAVVRLDNPRDDTREQGRMDFAAFTGTPGGIPMAFVRCYPGADG